MRTTRSGQWFGSGRLMVFAVSLYGAPLPAAEKKSPGIEDYATIEAWCGAAPVYAFGYTYVYGVSPDLLPGAVMQEGNQHPVVIIKPKKSWEIAANLCGSTPAREPKTAWNDDQPLLPHHPLRAGRHLPL